MLWHVVTTVQNLEVPVKCVWCWLKQVAPKTWFLLCYRLLTWVTQWSAVCIWLLWVGNWYRNYREKEAQEGHESAETREQLACDNREDGAYD